MWRLAGLILMIAGPVAAGDLCHDLWFARNATVDRAGYCFGSALGQAVFENAGCTGKQVSLNAVDTDLVARIQKRESEYGCKVNTRQTGLDVDDLAIRWQLVFQPIRDQFESACLGWLSAELSLHAGPGASTAVIGRVVRGAYVSYAYEPEGGWTFVTVSDANWTTFSGGWMHIASANESCVDIAG